MTEFPRQPGAIMKVSEYRGRQAVFVESGDACLATVSEAEFSTEWFKATFVASHPPAPSCELKLSQMEGEDPVKSWSEVPPFGERWDVCVRPGEFFAGPEHWQASFLSGGGFRVFFQPDYVERFIRRDVSWLDEFYNAEDELTEDDALEEERDEGRASGSDDEP